MRRGGRGKVEILEEEEEGKQSRKVGEGSSDGGEREEQERA